MKGGDTMKTAVKIAVSIAMVLGLSCVCFAQSTTTLPAIPVKAQILSSNGISVTISKVTSSGFVPDTSIDFGQLTLDTTNHIFICSWYYALDVTVNSNSSNWTITHAANSVSGAGTDLNSNINVTFIRQLTSNTSADLTNGKVSYLNSNGKSYSKTDFPTGWLRIYYGIATASSDNTGVSVIGATKPAGTYTGSVVLSLTTSA